MLNWAICMLSGRHSLIALLAARILLGRLCM